MNHGVIFVNFDLFILLFVCFMGETTPELLDMHGIWRS